MNREESGNEAPTRAIHNAYFELQEALQQYRRSKDAADQQAIEDAHGHVQDAVLAFYELLRPHLKHSKSVDGYWEGQPPTYHGNGTPPDPDNGKGILHVQRRNRRFELNGTDPSQLTSLDDWHESIELNDDVRVVGVQTNGELALVHFDAYQLGLKTLDNWETEYVTQQASIDGFMSGKEEIKRERNRVDMERLKRAARELAEAADELGFLSHTEVPTNTDPTPV